MSETRLCDCCGKRTNDPPITYGLHLCLWCREQRIEIAQDIDKRLTEARKHHDDWIADIRQDYHHQIEDFRRDGYRKKQDRN